MDPALIAMLCVLAACLLLSMRIGVAFGLAALSAIIVGDVPVMLFIQKYFNTFESYPLMAIPFFLFAGEIMARGSLAGVLLNFSNSLVGHIRGGLAHVSVLTCMFFGALCGSAPPTMAAVGGIMIPAMEKQGYPKAFAGAVNAAGGALGPIIPPSVAAIMYGASAGCSISDLFIACIPSGIIIALFYMVVSYVICRRGNYGTISPRASIGQRLRALWEAKWAIMVPVIVLGGIYGGITTPTEAGVVAVVYSLFVEIFITRQMNWPLFKKIAVAAARNTGIIMIIIAGANAIGQMMLFFGADQLVLDLFTGITGNRWVILGMFVALFFVLGCFMEGGAVILILTPLLMPVIAQYGINPIHFGVIFISTIVSGVITPPVGINLYLACSMSGAPFMEVCRAIFPFTLCMLAQSLVIAFIEPIYRILL